MKLPFVTTVLFMTNESAMSSSKNLSGPLLTRSFQFDNRNTCSHNMHASSRNDQHVSVCEWFVNDDVVFDLSWPQQIT